jgi:hypothetical protein
VWTPPLQSAKEAVGRQNKSSAMAILAWTVKQIDQMGLSIQTGQKPVDDRFSDIKDRLASMEGSNMRKGAADIATRAITSSRLYRGNCCGHDCFCYRFFHTSNAGSGFMCR